jgi:hypothetical protein
VTLTRPIQVHLEQLRTQLEERLPKLRGLWVARRTNYEEECASALGGTVAASTYWDCILDSGLKLELKKTLRGGMWFDLVRYGRVILEPELAADVVTLILRYALLPIPAVTQIAVIEHDALLQALRLDEEKAQILLDLKRGLPRSLNAQASLTWLDLTSAANFVVSS